jgi:alpha-1,4-galacturonosyltransferase
MKGGVSSYTLPAKRRWRGPVIAVLGLVLLSMLVPLVFLLGLHNGFHSSSTGYASERQNSSPDTLSFYDQHSTSTKVNYSKDGHLTHIHDLMQRLTPTLPKEFLTDSTKKPAENNHVGSPVPKELQKPTPKINNTKAGVVDIVAHDVTNDSTLGGKATNEVVENMKSVDDSEKSCEVKFGSYCLWRREHKEKMDDTMVKKMKDQLYVARAYYPSIAKIHALDKFSHEMKQNIQEFEKVLSETATDKDLPPQTGKKMQKMEGVITKAKSYHVDCNNVDKKLRQLVDLTEDEASFHRKQSAFLYQLAVQTMPKGLHCLSMRLTVEYFKSPLDMEDSLTQKYIDPDLQHFVIFSKNILASSAVINSTTINAKESSNQVFHVLTDTQNYFAMKLWFFRNTYKEATVQVLNVEDLNLNNNAAKGASSLSLPEEFRVSFRSVDKLARVQVRTEYISVFSHSQYLLPIIFENLKKVIVLGDDVIVQRDLSYLWSIDLNGKVNGAVQFCAVKLGELKTYFGENRFDENSCAWMSGLNIVDLEKWREQDVTGNYKKLVQERVSGEEGSVEGATLRASLLAFQGKIHALDDSVVISGLGHNYGVNLDAIGKAAVLHYNGLMKPWLELGIPRYKVYWRKFVNRDNQILADCNVNP